MYRDQRISPLLSKEYKRLNYIPLIAPLIVLLSLLLSITAPFWKSELLFHSNIPFAKNAVAASPATRQIDIPYFNTAVPFNQTAIFWFGRADSTDVYTDVRLGYNSSELYIDLRIVDRYLWYDTNKLAPNLDNGDNATIYLNAEKNGILDNTSYKFQAGVNGHMQQNNYQKAYIRNGTVWTATNSNFVTNYGWRGHGFNGVGEDSGWSMTYHIPFSSLGMTNSPPQGTLWKLAVRVHNKDNAANTGIPDKWWPETTVEASPSSWGNLRFGLLNYQPPVTSNNATYMIRNKLNNQVVTDAMVGGALGCGDNGLNRWNIVGNLSYPGAVHANIQNEADLSDWNCFSKWYMTFPLSSLPHGKGIANATVTLYEYGNSGVLGPTNSSHIQVAVINQDWNPATISWNNAPLSVENITSILVPTKSQPVIPWPGLAITWNVSIAVADAYTSGQPLRLVFYSTDDQHNDGKYFHSSYVGDWGANGRPTLQVTLGNIV